MPPLPESSAPPSPAPVLPAAEIKRAAIAIGFDLVGIAAPAKSAYGREYQAWLAAGRQGSMGYLVDSASARMDITTAFPWVKSVICLALSYYVPEDTGEQTGNGSPSKSSSMKNPTTTAKIARYAWGRDYHRVLMGKLRKLQAELRRLVPGDFACRAYVDTGPVAERELAARAGLGWIGKNTLLINPRHGSWFVLGELLTALPLECDSPISDRCGTCTRCLEACPTAALTPYQLDATRCISYQTLENRAEIPPELHAPMRDAGYIVGCDICQTVCPWNHRPLVTGAADFQPQQPAPAVDLAAVKNWKPEDWDKLTRGKAHRRAKLEMWRRTAKILAPE